MNLIISFLIISVQANIFDNLIWVSRRLPKPGEKNINAAEPRWDVFIQKMDNFDPGDMKVLNTRYLINDQFYKPDGPIFIMLGGETAIDPGWLQSGQMFDMAEKFNAIMFYLEHRYYGDSVPHSMNSLVDYPFLSSKQALADYAAFIKVMKKIYTNTKVIVFGGSYAGSLAIWMRYKYPDLVDGAVSSSAPLQAHLDFKQYFVFIQEKLSNQKCAETIKRGIKTIHSYLFSGPDGRKKVQKDLNLCEQINVYCADDLAFFYISIASIFGNIVQYKNDINKTCEELLKNDTTSDNEYIKLTRFISKKYIYCIPNYNQFTHYFSSYTTYRYEGYRQWLFQTCNEFGFFQTSSSPNEPFHNCFPINLNYQYCQDLFDYSPSRVRNGINETNAEYHGVNISVTKIIAVYGENDPWKLLGLKKDINPEAPVIIVPNATHCEDLYSISPSDDRKMKDAKLKVQKMVEKWVTGK